MTKWIFDGPLLIMVISSDNLLVKLVGTWEPREGSQQLYAASGIACEFDRSC